jgi:Clr5 domain
MEYLMTNPPFPVHHAPEPSYFTQNQGPSSQAIEPYSTYSILEEPAWETLLPAAQSASTNSHLLHSFDSHPAPYTTQSHNVQPFSDIKDRAVQTMGPPTNTRRKKAPTLRCEAWAPYKDRIIELHITQGLPLREVKIIIENDFGFIAEYVFS